jgi:hypothetical protein
MCPESKLLGLGDLGDRERLNALEAQRGKRMPVRRKRRSKDA